MDDKLDDIVSSYRKEFKKPLLTGADLPEVATIPTGLVSIDNMTVRRGGLPRGRFIELGGEQQAGKTTLMGYIVGQYVKKGMVVAYFDVEHRVDKEWFAKLGVNLEQALFPDAYAEAVFSESKYLVTKGVDLIVIDSVQFLQPRLVMDRKQEVLKMNESLERAQVWKQFTSELQGGFSYDGKDYKLQDCGTTVIALNHIFESNDGFIPQKETLGGKGIRNAASIRLFLSRGTNKIVIEDGKEIARVKVKCVKNSIAPPMRTGFIRMNLTDGVVEDDWDELIKIWRENKKLEGDKRRYYITVNGVPRSFEREALIEELKTNVELLEHLNA